MVLIIAAAAGYSLLSYHYNGAIRVPDIFFSIGALAKKGLLLSVNFNLKLLICHVFI